MNVEIINTSGRDLAVELIIALKAYAPYHHYEEQRNRVVIDMVDGTYTIRCIMLRVDLGHVMIWISDWYIQPGFSRKGS